MSTEPYEAIHQYLHGLFDTIQYSFNNYSEGYESKAHFAHRKAFDFEASGSRFFIRASNRTAPFSIAFEIVPFDIEIQANTLPALRNIKQQLINITMGNIGNVGTIQYPFNVTILSFEPETSFNNQYYSLVAHGEAKWTI